MQDTSMSLTARASFNIGLHRKQPTKMTLHARKIGFMILYLHSARSTLAPELTPPNLRDRQKSLQCQDSLGEICTFFGSRAANFIIDFCYKST